MECVSKIKLIFSVIFHTLYEAVYIQLTHLSYADRKDICTLSYYHHQIGSLTYLPLFRVRSWNNGMCCMSFLYFISTVRGQLVFNLLISNAIQMHISANHYSENSVRKSHFRSIFEWSSQLIWSYSSNIPYIQQGQCKYAVNKTESIVSFPCDGTPTTENI